MYTYIHTYMYIVYTVMIISKKCVHIYIYIYSYVHIYIYTLHISHECYMVSELKTSMNMWLKEDTN